MPSIDVMLLVLIALATTAVALGVALWRRQDPAAEFSERQSQLAASIVAQKATLDVMDARLAQLHNQFNEDANRLREQVSDRLDNFRQTMSESLADNNSRTMQQLGEIREQTQNSLGEHRTRVEEQNARGLKTLEDSMRAGYESLNKQLGESLLRSSTDVGQRVDALTKATDERLREIGGQVDKRLTDGFEKTTATFADVIKRLALIDEAQKKITALSGEVVSLQELLSDKRSRGAFGEVQLSALVGNVMPKANYALQHRLTNDRIADCVLFLPEPTGMVCIDSKFPLESYRVMTDHERAEHERKAGSSQFKQDIKKHIKDIAERYIIENETADGAVMFLPAEAVFAEIQANHPDLTDIAHAARVWLASPTTLWAILNTARAVIKDAATREQVDIIQNHLGRLGGDFKRFRERMDKLAKHIQLANDDVSEVNISARKISDRFEKIEQVELEMENRDQLGVDEP